LHARCQQDNIKIISRIDYDYGLAAEHNGLHVHDQRELFDLQRLQLDTKLHLENDVCEGCPFFKVCPADTQNDKPELKLAARTRQHQYQKWSHW